jgi:hypothetical protein
VKRFSSQILPDILGLRPLLVLHIHISPSTSPGQRNCAWWVSQRQKSVTLRPQPGGETTKSIRDMWWHWKKSCLPNGSQNRRYFRSQHQQFKLCSRDGECLLRNENRTFECTSVKYPRYTVFWKWCIILVQLALWTMSVV